MPSLDRRNSRTWLEWAVPRDLMTVRARLRSPPSGRKETLIQVSAIAEICAWVTSLSLPRSSNVVSMNVMPLDFA